MARARSTAAEGESDEAAINPETMVANCTRPTK
jgi:hypothetical protein